MSSGVKGLTTVPVGKNMLEIYYNKKTQSSLP